LTETAGNTFRQSLVPCVHVMPYLERLTLALSRRLGGRLQRVVRPIRRAL